jgi:hypothetical protein
VTAGSRTWHKGPRETSAEWLYCKSNGDVNRALRWQANEIQTALQKKQGSSCNMLQVNYEIRLSILCLF